MPSSVTFTAVTSNICGNPLRAKAAVRRRMRRAAEIAGKDGVNFGQECAGSNVFRIPPKSGNYAALWRTVMRNHAKTTYGSPHEVPISVPKDWKVLTHSTRQLHGGKAKVSPARFATIVVVDFDGLTVAFIDCHTVSKPRKGVPASAWRLAHFKTYLDELSALVAEQHRAGHTVIFGGDMNHRTKGLPQIHPYQKVLVESGLDHLWYVPAAGHKVTRIRSRKVPRTALMDHPILSAAVKIERTS